VVDRSKPRRAGSSAAATARHAAIWRAVAAIPRGTVATYGGIATSAGYPRGARLVAPALKLAPAALGLPWHRVVAAGGRIAFPAGSRLYREQRRRLESEGLRVRRGRVALPRVADLDALLWGSDG
jgi:methylated-DNA-protein-cysteine methyltransferase related protein